MNWDVWGAPFVVLAVGVVVGLVLALRSTGQGRRDPKAELTAKKDALIDQLRSLRADRVKLSRMSLTSAGRGYWMPRHALRGHRGVARAGCGRFVVDGPSSGGRWPRRALGCRGDGVLCRAGCDAPDCQPRAPRGRNDDRR